MPHIQPSIVEQRVRNLIQRLRRLAVDEHATVACSATVGRCGEPVPWAERLGLDYGPIAIGDTWGETWSSAWLHVTATVPKDWAGAYVVARIDVAGEALVFTPAGEPIAALCQGSVFDEDYAKDILHLLPKAAGGEAINLWVEAAANHLFGVTTTDPERPHQFKDLHGVHRGTLRQLHLARLDPATYALLHDFEVLADLWQNLPEGSPRKAKLLLGLDRAVSEHHRAGAAAAAAALAPLLAVPVDPAALRFTGVGHAHIDTAWLWPLRETVRKTARTFSNQLDLIARYPGYVFGASQPQLYQFVKDGYPGLYQRVKEAVASGGWEVQGAMWVEADCNLPNGESLVRQVLIGKRFFKSEFGVEVKNLWLPDVFGYSGQLPQILAKAGVPYFLTQKLSWNKVNTFPHNTFVWKGIDGSEVLAHFPPENDYNARCRPGPLIKAQERHQERGIIDEAISLFGIGDGGGGPNEEFVERALRMQNLNGCPPYQFGHAQPVFERMNEHRAEFARWNGELYFECHRATYTTQAAMKRANRRAEEALALCEQLSASAGLASYPAAELDGMWKTVLTNQFHDIIPGSSIHRVYAEAVPADLAVAARAQELATTAAASVLRADATRATVYNPSATGFDDLVTLPAGWTGAALNGAVLPTQTDGATTRVRVRVAGHSAVALTRQDAAVAAAKADQVLELANDVVRYRFAANGTLISAVLLADGQELLTGPANELVLYEDRPHCYDAWDIDEQVTQAPVGGLTVTAIQRHSGAAWSEIELHGTVGQSTVVQHIRLRPGSTRLDFVTDVAWNERHKLLRVRFPTAIVSDGFTGEVQYGHVTRPTHRNTTWDAARFEVCCHRWADLSERTRGVALLNDSKYGYDCLGGTLGLSLLRAPTSPDPIADIGDHRFTYALLPHRGDLFEAPVRAEAAMLNAGVAVLPGLDGSGFTLPVKVEGDGLELAVLKRAEDGGALIVRVAEVRGAPAHGKLIAPGKRLIPTDLMEWADRPADARAGAIDVQLGAFAIETYRVV
jgi:alpha-mannosidase